MQSIAENCAITSSKNIWNINVIYSSFGYFVSKLTDTSLIRPTAFQIDVSAFHVFSSSAVQLQMQILSILHFFLSTLKRKYGMTTKKKSWLSWKGSNKWDPRYLVNRALYSEQGEPCGANYSDITRHPTASSVNLGGFLLQSYGICVNRAMNRMYTHWRRKCDFQFYTDSFA